MAEIDAMEYVEPDEEQEKDARKSRLNTLVAITVALLATFLGICQVTDGNVAQAMEQAQTKSNDTWAWYQFRKVRGDVFQATADQLRLQSLAAPAALRPEYARQLAAYQAKVKEQQEKMAETQKQAEGFDKQYDTLGVRDDQFDLSEAFISLAVALLAMTALTQKRWLYGLALAPTALGVMTGLGGLANWNLAVHVLTRFLS